MYLNDVYSSENYMIDLELTNNCIFMKISSFFFFDFYQYQSEYSLYYSSRKFSSDYLYISYGIYVLENDSDWQIQHLALSYIRFWSINKYMNHFH